ncbi:MAG: hypothetical protein LBD15_01185 [Holosporales bacterium]|jgi:cell division protein FtsL|nr:hypothetical protein [Holosporales bacterium]
MAHRTTFALLFLTICMGLALFHLKYQVIGVEEELRSLLNEIESEEERQHVLKAEWKYATDAQRLQKLAQKHLGFSPVKPQQLMDKRAFLRAFPIQDALGNLIETEENPSLLSQEGARR